MDLVAVTRLQPVIATAHSHYQRQYPPAKFVFAQEGRRMGIAVDSIVSMVRYFRGARHPVHHFPDVRVNSYTEVENSIIYTHAEIGRYSRIRRAIIGPRCSHPEHTDIGMTWKGPQEIPVSESGIVVVVPEQRMFEAPSLQPGVAIAPLANSTVLFFPTALAAHPASAPTRVRQRLQACQPGGAATRPLNLRRREREYPLYQRLRAGK